VNESLATYVKSPKHDQGRDRLLPTNLVGQGWVLYCPRREREQPQKGSTRGRKTMKRRRNS
jgi:hypothetical protein